MHLCGCQHPSYEFNKYLGRDVRVNCGKCDSCLNARAKKWVSRLLLERQCHKYCVMFNLTYMDEFLPSLGFSDDFQSLVWDDRHSHLDCIPLHELTSLCKEDKDLQYLSDRLCHGLALPVHCVDDYQKFFKRLNKYIHDKYTQTYENFRYFLCTEYGPATFRPHAHGILFLDNERVANDIQKIVSACWSFGDSPCSHIFSDGGFNYVAQYVNMSSHLPAFYSFNTIRQRQLFSKCPALGSGTLLASEVREVYDRKPINRTVWDSQAARYIDIPVSDSFKSRFFPKCPQYSTRSYSDRIALYRCTQELPAQDFRQFCDSLHFLDWSYSRGLCNKVQSIIKLYIDGLKRDSKNDESLRSSLYRLYLCGKRVSYIANCLHSSVEYVVKHIDEFYKKVDYQHLKEFYEWQSSYTVSHSVSDLMFAYPEFVRDYQFYDSYPTVSCSDSFLYALDSFKIDTLNPPDLKNTFDYIVMCNRSFKIYKDTHKAHDVNNYRYSTKLKRLNPSLQKILIKYAEA